MNPPHLAHLSAQVVKEAEKKILERELSGLENKEYLAMEGLPAFNKARSKARLGPPPLRSVGAAARPLPRRRLLPTCPAALRHSRL